MLFAAVLHALAPSSFAGECPTKWKAAEVDTRLARAEETYVALEMDAFHAAMDDAAIMLPCVTDDVPPAMAARYHRLQGVVHFLAGDEVGAKLSFAAGRVVDPAYRFPDAMFHAAHALRVTYEGLPTKDGRTSTVAPPNKGHLSFDGTTSRKRPADRATIVQIYGPETAPQTTAYLLPKDPLPEYAHVPTKRVPMLIASAVALGAAGTLYGLAWSAHDSALDPSDTTMTNARLATLKDQSLVFTLASGGALLTGAGLAVVGVLPEPKPAGAKK